MKNYGLPYQGSKNRIIPWLMAQFPADDTFVDLFAGGCAVTHAAMLSGRFKHFIANDITDSALVFHDALDGRFNDERRWISREDFFRLKDTDPYVRLCYSFGNDQRSYCYAREIEPIKRAAHYAVVFDDWQPLHDVLPSYADGLQQALSGMPLITPEDIQARRIKFTSTAARLTRIAPPQQVNGRWGELCHLERYVRLKGLQLGADANCAPPRNIYVYKQQHPEATIRLQQLALLRASHMSQSLVTPPTTRIEHLERVAALTAYRTSRKHPAVCFQKNALASLQCLQGDYADVPIPDGSLIYCDPPYADTKKYTVNFDKNRFYDWCRSQKQPVYVSEYQMPSDFTCIAETETTSNMNADRPVKAVERLFVQSQFARQCCRSLFMP